MVRFRKNKDRRLSSVPDLPPSEGARQEPDKSSREAGKAALRLVGESDAGLQSKEPTGELKLPDGRNDIFDIIIALNERQKGEKPDANVYKMERAFLLLGQIASYDRPLEDILGHNEFSGAVESNEPVFMAARTYDALEDLKQAFEYARPDLRTGQRNQSGLVRLSHQILPTEAWNDPGARDLLLAGIDEAYLLCQDVYHRHSNSIDAYVSRIQDLLVEHGMGLKKPPSSADYSVRRQFEIDKQRIIDEAWEEWEEWASGGTGS